jgi:hypothetical protein
MDDDLFAITAEDESGDERYWTARRILFTVIILLTLLAFLVYSILYGLIQRQPLPLPTPTLPLNQV